METNVGKKVIISGDRSGVEFGALVAHNGRVIGHVVDVVRGHCFDVIYVDPVSTSTLQAVVTDHEGDVEIVGNIYDNPEMLKKGGAE